MSNGEETKSNAKRERDVHIHQATQTSFDERRGINQKEKKRPVKK